jgi:hypothetical protein
MKAAGAKITHMSLCRTFNMADVELMHSHVLWCEMSCENLSSKTIQHLISPQTNLSRGKGLKSPDQRQDVTGLKFGSKDRGLSGVNKVYGGSVVGKESG